MYCNALMQWGNSSVICIKDMIIQSILLMYAQNFQIKLNLVIVLFPYIMQGHKVMERETAKFTDDIGPPQVKCRLLFSSIFYAMHF